MATVVRSRSDARTSDSRVWSASTKAPWILLGALLACDPGDDTSNIPLKPPPSAHGSETDGSNGRPKTARGSSRTPEETVRGVVELCHERLKGADKMENCLVQTRHAADATETEDILLGSERRMKITRLDRSRQLLLGDQAWEISPKPVDGPEKSPPRVKPITGQDLAELQRYRELIRATLLQPLYRFDTARRQGPGIYQLIMEGGATWRLELRDVQTPAGKSVSLPDNLIGPHGKVTFSEYLHTGPTHLPKRVTLDTFGERWFKLADQILSYEPGVFAAPDEKPVTKRVLTPPTGFRPDPKIGTPEIRTVGPKKVLVFPDPGDWKQRYKELRANGSTLAGQGQRGDDLDFLFDRDGKRYLGMPFTMDEENGKPFVKKPDQVVLDLPTHRVVLLYPKNGSIEDCEARARAVLEPFLEKKGLVQNGPMRIIPWVNLNKPLPSKRDLQHLRVGFEVPVEH